MASVQLTESGSKLLQPKTLEEISEALNGQDWNATDLDAITHQLYSLRIPLPLIRINHRRESGQWEILSEPSDGEMQRADLYLQVAKKYKKISDTQISSHKYPLIEQIKQCFTGCCASENTLSGKRWCILSDAQYERVQLNQMSLNYSET